MDERCLPVVGPRAAGNSPSATKHGTVDHLREARLRKSDILRGYGAFRAVLTQDRSVRVDGLRCFIGVSQKIPPGRVQVGFAVRRPSGAVERNRIKRHLREAYRLSRVVLDEAARPCAAGVACVILLAADRYRTIASFAQLCEMMQSLLHKAAGEVVSL